MAARDGRQQLVKALLHAHANPRRPGQFGVTPVMAAVAGGHVQCVRELLAGKGSPNVAREDGVTPVFLAAKQKDMPVLQALMEAEASTREAVVMAKASKQQAVLDFLVTAGVSVLDVEHPQTKSSAPAGKPPALQRSQTTQNQTTQSRPPPLAVLGRSSTLTSTEQLDALRRTATPPLSPSSAGGAGLPALATVEHGGGDKQASPRSPTFGVTSTPPQPAAQRPRRLSPARGSGSEPSAVEGAGRRQGADGVERGQGAALAGAPAPAEGPGEGPSSWEDFRREQESRFPAPGPSCEIVVPRAGWKGKGAALRMGKSRRSIGSGSVTPTASVGDSLGEERADAEELVEHKPTHEEGETEFGETESTWMPAGVVWLQQSMNRMMTGCYTRASRATSSD
mmetsp:Transcript_86424/g.231514  ORF Transcript_86424/g.231514 Transcript_86424/m.231514 type:complete len:396 (-) Transcript_86424:137-1324(-)